MGELFLLKSLTISFKAKGIALRRIISSIAFIGFFVNNLYVFVII